tara:strand:- start:43 stop:537 length:495 start_codon:yes stop_codon:yes gene_type:complete
MSKNYDIDFRPPTLFEDNVLAYSKDKYVVNTLSLKHSDMVGIKGIMVNATDFAIFNLEGTIIISGEFDLCNISESPNSKVSFENAKGEVDISITTEVLNIEELTHSEDISLKFWINTVHFPICGICQEHVRGNGRVHICAQRNMGDENATRDAINTPLFKAISV